jgi:hypothetical protein
LQNAPTAQPLGAFGFPATVLAAWQAKPPGKPNRLASQTAWQAKPPGKGKPPDETASARKRTSTSYQFPLPKQLSISF